MSALSLNDRLQNLSQEIQDFNAGLGGDLSNLNVHDLEPIKQVLAALQDSFANLEQEVSLLHLPRWDAYSKRLAQIRSDLQNTAAKVHQVRDGMISRYVSGPVTRKVDQDFFVLEETSRVIQQEFRDSNGPLNQSAHDMIQIYCANAEIEITGQRIGEKSNQLLDEWRNHTSEYSY